MEHGGPRPRAAISYYRLIIENVYFVNSVYISLYYFLFKNLIYRENKIQYCLNCKKHVIYTQFQEIVLLLLTHFVFADILVFLSLYIQEQNHWKHAR